MIVLDPLLGRSAANLSLSLRRSVAAKLQDV